MPSRARLTPQRSEAELLAAALRLLRSYHSGKLRAFLSNLARSEQHLRETLSIRDQHLVQSLLALPQDEELQTAALSAMGLEKATRLLEMSLGKAAPIHRGWRQVWPFIEDRFDGVTWLFERVELGETGLVVFSLVCTSWTLDAKTPLNPVGSATDPVGEQPGTRWDGFSEIWDDVGTVYTFLTARVAHNHRVQIRTGDGEIIHQVDERRESWAPGVPAEATTLVLVPSPDIEVRPPFRPDTLGAAQRVSLGSTRYEIGLWRATSAT